MGQRGLKWRHYATGQSSIRPSFPSSAKKVLFSLRRSVKPALGHTWSLIKWEPGALSVRLGRQGRESDRLPPSSGKVKNDWRLTSSPPPCLHGFSKNSFVSCPLTYLDNFLCQRWLRISHFCYTIFSRHHTWYPQAVLQPTPRYCMTWYIC
jgi:hypothetical protein